MATGSVTMTTTASSASSGSSIMSEEEGDLGARVSGRQRGVSWGDALSTFGAGEGRRMAGGHGGWSPRLQPLL